MTYTWVLRATIKTQEERILIALRAAERDEMSMNKAARRFGLTRVTLQERKKGGRSHAEEGRRRQKLDTGETLVLRSYID